MSQASKEGNAEVIASLKESLAAAMEVKQRSLRPEIQLLNQLLSDRAFADRAVVSLISISGTTFVLLCVSPL